MNQASFEKDFCVQKIEAVIALITRLLDTDFPHTDSKKALKQLYCVFETEKDRLIAISPKAQQDTILGYCRDANVLIVSLQKYIGMLIRSSNLRNAFEIFFPIKTLATELLDQKDICLVLSSEWSFSPFTYPVAMEQLPNSIFIGVPASESGNPLIVPLAGHELGHVVWNRKGAKEEFDPIVAENIISIYKERWSDVCERFGDQPIDKLESDLFLRRIWGKSLALAKRQVEEIFCDYVGVYAFGPSFLHSFRYLVAPSLGKIRNLYYPAIGKRAQYMEFVANQYGIPTIDGFSSAFNEQMPQLSKQDELIVEIADIATEKMHIEIANGIKKFSGKLNDFTENNISILSIENNLKSLVPADSADSIASIVNAGWNLRLRVDEWDILDHIEDRGARRREKMRVLNDLLLKSFEVYEYRKRLEAYAS